MQRAFVSTGAQALIRTTMDRAAAMSVPLVAEVGHGTSWEKAH